MTRARVDRVRVWIACAYACAARGPSLTSLLTHIFGARGP